MDWLLYDRDIGQEIVNALLLDFDNVYVLYC